MRSAVVVFCLVVVCASAGAKFPVEGLQLYGARYSPDASEDLWYLQPAGQKPPARGSRFQLLDERGPFAEVIVTGMHDEQGCSGYCYPEYVAKFVTRPDRRPGRLAVAVGPISRSLRYARIIFPKPSNSGVLTQMVYKAGTWLRTLAIDLDGDGKSDIEEFHHPCCLNSAGQRTNCVELRTANGVVMERYEQLNVWDVCPPPPKKQEPLNEITPKPR